MFTNLSAVQINRLSPPDVNKAAELAPAPNAPRRRRDADIEAKARQGELPPPPDFSAPTHARFRAKLAQIVALAEAGDIAALPRHHLPYQPGRVELAEHDPLRDYYLDLDQLRATDERDVEKLLASFWTRMQGGEEKRAALELFELDDATQVLSLAIIKHRYRQLVSQHHPDRGGSTARLQSINKAMEILERYYGRL